MHAVNNRGDTAIRAIVVMGLLALLLLMLGSFALRRTLTADDAQRVPEQAAQSPFDGERAYADLANLVGLGPRPTGSDANAEARSYVTAELHKAGITAETITISMPTPDGMRTLHHVSAMIPGDRPETILICTRYDTPPIAGITFAGANESGAGAAWLLEFARAVGSKRTGCALRLVWIDGESDAQGDDLYLGSASLVDRFKAENTLRDVAAAICVARIGDCFLGIGRDRGAPKWLEDALWESSLRLGFEKHFTMLRKDLPGSHLAFRKAGIPSLHLVDISYGGSPMTHQQYFHTEADSLDKVCAESLQAVGDVVYHALAEIDKQQDG